MDSTEKRNVAMIKTEFITQADTIRHRTYNVVCAYTSYTHIGYTLSHIKVIWDAWTNAPQLLSDNYFVGS